MSQANRTIAIFANNYWNSPYQVGTHHIAREFLKLGWTVLYISDPWDLLDEIRWLVRGTDKPRRREVRPRQLEPGLFAFVPRAPVTCSFHPLLDRVFIIKHWFRLTIPPIGKLISRLGLGEPDLILVNSVHYGWALRSFSRARSILRIADWYERPRAGSKCRLDTIRRSDIAFAASRAVIEEHLRPLVGHKVEYLPNGVSLGAFDRKATQPPEFSAEPRMKVLYVGSLDERFDFPLVCQAAALASTAVFYIVGNDVRGLSRQSHPGNIVFLGVRAHRDLSGYLAHSNVAIMPQTRTLSATDYFNPLKLYQYMHFRLPVVSTWWKELDYLDPPIQISRPDCSDFAELVSRSLEGPRVDPGAYDRFLTGRDWSDIVRTMIESVERLHPLSPSVGHDHGQPE